MKNVFLFMANCLLFIGCNKNVLIDEKDAINNQRHEGLTMDLWDKPVDTIQLYIEGKWKVNYFYGGFIANLKDDREKYKEYWEFSSDMRYSYTREGVIIQQGTYSWVTFQLHARDYVHKTVDGMFEPYRIKNDTLVLATPHYNNPDFQLWFLTKAN